MLRTGDAFARAEDFIANRYNLGAGGSGRAATCKRRFSKGKIVKMLGNSRVIRANSPLFATAFLLFSLTVSLTVATGLWQMHFMASDGLNIGREIGAILDARVGRMTAGRVEPAARVLPDSAAVIPMKAENPKDFRQSGFARRGYVQPNPFANDLGQFVKLGQFCPQVIQDGLGVQTAIFAMCQKRLPCRLRVISMRV